MLAGQAVARLRPAPGRPRRSALLGHLVIVISCRAALARVNGVTRALAVKRIALSQAPAKENSIRRATKPYYDSNIFRASCSRDPDRRIEASTPPFHESPLAPTHILLIRSVHTSRFTIFERASDAESADFVRTVGKVARDHGLVAPGYRLLANVGAHGGQEVPHLHVHIFAGRGLGPMLAR